MIELKRDIFDRSVMESADLICFTSNGIVKTNNCLVMGAGVAKQFAERWPWLPRDVGDRVSLGGNVPYLFSKDNQGNKLSPMISNFPTKHHYKDPSDLGLIERSAILLLDLVEKNKISSVFLPYPGIGLGRLNIFEVRKVLFPILDDRFHVLVK